MNASNLNYTPIVNYTGAVDTSDLSGNYGSTIFNVLYDPIIITLGNLLMFEYKIEKDQVIQNTGVITTSTSSNVGIINNWSVSVPALSNSYDPSMTISIRAYIGQYKNVIGVTNWSAPLNLYNPPPQPVITSAYYDHVSPDASGISQNDDLYVFLESGTNTTGVQFVVAYKYTDYSDSIKWGISSPTTATGRYNNEIIVRNFGEVNLDKKIVYVSLYAVYTFVDVSNNNIYTLSHISNIFEAKPILGQEMSRPIINLIEYNVYTTPTQEQTMTVNWTAPVISNMSSFPVQGYRVEMSDSSFNIIDASNIYLGSATYATIDVSRYGCAKTVYFRVIAIFLGGESMSTPSSKKIFTYSGSPQELDVLYASYIDSSSNSMNMSVNFKNPVSYGCGDPKQFIIEVYDSSKKLINNPTLDKVTYNLSNNYQPVIVNTTQFSRAGIVKVYLQTKDTNSDRLLDGATTQDTFISSSLPIFDKDKIVKTTDGLTFDIITYSPLSGSGSFTPQNSKTSIGFLIDNKTAVITTINSGVYNGAYRYKITIHKSVFPVFTPNLNPNSGRPTAITVANSTGPSSITVGI